MRITSMPTCSPLFSREKKWRHKNLSGLHPPGVEAGSILTGVRGASLTKQQRQ
jgi:hypothetical protein